MSPARIVDRRLMRRLFRMLRLTQRNRSGHLRNRPCHLHPFNLWVMKNGGRIQDPELRALIRTALKNNYDVRIAATRVLEAQAQLGITRADQLPSLSAGGNVTSVQNPQLGPIPAYELTQGEVAASAGWNLDFWGKYRRATEAARANLLANEWAQKEVMATLVANLATSYFQLRQLDLELEISRRTLNSRNDSLQLTRTLEQHGINSMLDVRQSEQLVYTAATEIPDFERQIAQQENAISILLGKTPAMCLAGSN